MSFYCNATKAVVVGQEMALVPIEIRKVKYVGIHTNVDRNTRRENHIVTGEWDGWEVVRELPVAKEKAAEFALQFPPITSDKVKVVKFQRRRPRVPRESYERYDREEND